MAKPKAADHRPQVIFAPNAESVAGAEVLWTPNPGPQTEVMLREEFEILFGGAKGGGKTEAGRMWLLQGNPREKFGHPCDVSYINHPHYRALILRLNRKDLETWVQESFAIYSKLGAKLVESPTTEFVWPSGARFVVDHLADDTAYTKYAGNAFVRMVLEEATQIPNYARYGDVIINCRSKFREMRKQIFLTANPGGPGMAWVTKRFLTDRPETYGRTLSERQKNLDGKERRVTRVFIPSKLIDNPKMREADPDYEVRLMSTLAGDENKRRALLDGDWTALSGQYFTAFRPNGPLISEANEYPWARHVIPACKLPAHWPRWMGMDWGYRHHSVILWACQDPNGQVHAYREKALAGVSPEELGAELAMESLKDLDGIEAHQMSLYLSPDAFQQRTDERTIADQLAVGIRHVLGPQSAFVMHKDDIGEGDPTSFGPARDFFEMREFQQQKAGIVLRRAQNHRVAGWQYMHSLMRFKPLVPLAKNRFDPVYAMKLAEESAAKYFEYLRAFERAHEVLPVLQIHDCCSALIRAIPTAVHWEDKNPDDVRKTDEPEDDVLDSCFVAGTAVLTDQGEVPIERVQVGDRVLTRAGYQRVMDAGETRQNAEVFAVQMSDGNRIIGTANHPVFVNGEFKLLGDLQPGDELLPQRFRRCEVIGVRPCGNATVYNLTVEGQPEYFANGVLVHNCRYLLMGHKYHVARQPLQQFVTQRIGEISARRGGLEDGVNIQIARKAEQDWKGQQEIKPFVVSRASGRRAHWNN